MALALLVGTLQGASPSQADLEERNDRKDRSHSPTDIASISHDHAPGEDALLRHTIRFDGEPEGLDGVGIFFRYRNKGGSRVTRELRIGTNPGRGLYGRVRSPSGAVKAFTRAWMEDASTLVVEFPTNALGALPRDRYRWYVWSILGAGEFDDPCSGEEAGPPVCRDRAPREGAIVHRL